jgi:hypothetical protein
MMRLCFDGTQVKTCDTADRIVCATLARGCGLWRQNSVVPAGLARMADEFPALKRRAIFAASFRDDETRAPLALEGFDTAS